MTLPRLPLIALITAFVAGARAWNYETYGTCKNLPSCGDTIQKDFVIVGGGASGVYAAVRLKEMGHSFTLVEAKNILGGNAEEYVDPATGAFVDIGVLVYPNSSIVYDFYARFDVPLKQMPPVFSGTTSEYYDFSTGQPVTVPASDTNMLTTAFTNYAAQALQYTSLQNGWDLPDPIPEDLVTPFGEVAAKYNFTAAIPVIYTVSQGAGDILQNLALYPYNLVDLQLLLAIEQAFLVPDNVSTHLVYDKTLELLKSDVLLSSTVQSADRPLNGSLSDTTTITVQTETCIQKIEAKRLTITIKPMTDILSPFGLDDYETNIFSKLEPAGYYTAVVKNSGLSETGTIFNVNTSSPVFLSSLPGIYSLMPTRIPGHHSVKYGSTSPLPDYFVQADMIASIKRVAEAQGIESNPELVIFSDHSPFELKASADDIRAGFYRDFRGLQGYRNTFYTGAAFRCYRTDSVWTFTEQHLPGWVASLG